MQSLSENDWNNKGYHPEIGEITVSSLFDFYLEHGEGYLSKISELVKLEK